MDRLGALGPDVRSPLLSAQCAALVDALANSECPALTARRARRHERSGASHDPIVWSEAAGANVLDAGGNRYVDLSAGFGAAALGHSAPAVVEAVRRQAGRLSHALGDLHPSDVKVELLVRLCALAPWPEARVMLGLSGSDAVEAALKTAVLKTGRAGVLAFEGGYHGLAHGPLALCGLSEAFRAPFAGQLNEQVCFAPYPRAGHDLQASLDAVARAWNDSNVDVGAVVVEPVLGRGGVVVPPTGWLAALGELARSRGALLVVDEVMTGLGRAGAMLCSVADGAEADLICIGKALGGGLPVSACIGTHEAMAAWGQPDGQALHTGTFMGNPLGCAAALATLEELEATDLASQATATGKVLKQKLQALAERHSAVVEVRGRGLLVGVEFDDAGRSFRLMRELLEAGYITVPAGADGRVMSLTPALNIAPALLDGFVEALDRCLEADK